MRSPKPHDLQLLVARERINRKERTSSSHPNLRYCTTTTIARFTTFLYEHTSNEAMRNLRQALSATCYHNHVDGLVKLLHGSFTSILSDRGQEVLEVQLERFFTVYAWKWDSVPQSAGDNFWAISS